MTLPKSYKDINISQFNSIYDLFQDQTLEPLDRNIKLLAQLTSKPLSEIEAMPLPELTGAIKQMAGITDLNFIAKPLNFKCGGYYWKPVKDSTKLGTSQFIDLSVYTENPDNIIQNLPKILATVCTPYKMVCGIRFNCNIPFQRKCELLEEARVSDVYPIALFFCQVYEILLPDILIYLNEKTQKIVKEAMQEAISMQDSQLNTQPEKNGF